MFQGDLVSQPHSPSAFLIKSGSRSYSEIFLFLITKEASRPPCTFEESARDTKLAAPYSSGTITNLSQIKDLYTPRGFFDHAASLPQTFVHWGRFSTAASRRSQGSVSVPVRRVVLSHPLLVIALVSHYLTNKLISHRPLPDR